MECDACAHWNQNKLSCRDLGSRLQLPAATSAERESDLGRSAAVVVGCTAGAADSNTAGVAAGTSAAGAVADNGTAGVATDSVVAVAPAAGGLAPCTAGAAAGTAVDPLAGICTFE